VSQVVVLGWDEAAGILDYVPVNGGAGGVAVPLDISGEWMAGVALELAGRGLPVTAELVIDGDAVLIGNVGGRAVQVCRVMAVGSPGRRQFRLRLGGFDKTVTLDAADLGVPDDQVDAAQQLRYVYVPGLTPPGCWLDCPGGIDEWAAERRRARDERERQKQNAREERERQEQNAREFINPYTFVPFPERIDRDRPAGHQMLGDGRLCGTFTVTWTFSSPFQAPEGMSGTTVLEVPGSSVKGAVRSVHEVLAGGCLRVFGADFVPSYRDTPKPRPEGWTLAQVVTATKDGQPLTVRLCEDVVWVPAAKLRDACGSRSLATGSRVDLIGGIPAEPNSLGRKELGADGMVKDGGEWVVLVTSQGTRSAKKGTYFLACGRLGEGTAEVTEEAWRAFRLAVEGASDLTPAGRARLGVDPHACRPTSPVFFDDQRIGLRRVVTRHLWPDDVIWVRASDPGNGERTAGELSLAAVWRHPGWPVGGGTPADQSKWAARARVPEELLACADPEWLCPTCRIFGSTDEHARDGDSRAAQRGYAGHVRFGTARSAGPVTLEQITRAPMGGPRPGAGQFYLAYDDRSPARGREDEPTREWGSAPDAAQPRRLRGRKFYWHADPRQQDPPRHKARAHQTRGKLASERWIAPAGTVLVQQVSFDNLSRAELGGLLAAFDPARVLRAGGRPVRIHLGGGKPLGLGSCATAVTGLRVWDAASRYGGGAEPAVDPDACAQAFADSCPGEVRATWPSLAAVLAEGTVDAARVWYPPGAWWPDRSENEKAFDEPFAFFTASSGKYLAASQRRELIPLPDPAGADQNLPIVREADLKDSRKAGPR